MKIKSLFTLKSVCSFGVIMQVFKTFDVIDEFKSFLRVVFWVALFDFSVNKDFNFKLFT